MGGVSVGCMDVVSAKSQPSHGYLSKDTASEEEGGRFDYCSTLIMLISLVVFGVSVWTILMEDPRFSVQLTGLGGLDRPAEASPTFNLTVHVDNRNDVRRFCRKKTAIALSYNHMAVGWGELPPFCVDRWSATDLNVSLTHGGVFLSQRMRDSMAADLHVGDLELGVELKQIHPEDGRRPCFHSCAGKFREIASPCTRSCLWETIS
jgi:hypothetical protein